MSAGRHENDLRKCVSQKILKNGFLYKYRQFLKNLDWQSRNKWGFASMGAHICYFSIFSNSKSKVEISVFWNVGRPTFQKTQNSKITIFWTVSKLYYRCHRVLRTDLPVLFHLYEGLWNTFVLAEKIEKNCPKNDFRFQMSAGRHFKKSKFQLCF